MNKRTVDLFAQALDEAVPETWTTLGPVQLMRLRDKFAELIVRECARISIENEGVWTIQGKQTALEFMEHFGVEE